MRSVTCLFLALLFLLPIRTWGGEGPVFLYRHLLATPNGSYFLDQTGVLWHWGGEGAKPPHPIMQDVASMSSGAGTLYVLKRDSTLWGMGNSRYGQLGRFTKKRIENYVQILTDVQAVEANGWTIYALKKNRTLWTWGTHNSFEKGGSKNPQKVFDKVIRVAAGNSHTLAIREDGTLWSWGSNRCGRLGAYEDIESRTRPSRVDMEPLEGRSATGIVALWAKNFVVTQDGLVWHWGNDDYAKCDAFPPYATNPERLTFIDNVHEIAATPSAFYILALKKDGTVWAWGITGAIGLPEGSWDNPRQVLSGVAEIAVGEDHALALKKDGTVWAWGSNSYGQLGPGREEVDYMPRQVSISGIPPLDKADTSHLTR